jgi:hypothetical protein
MEALRTRSDKAPAPRTRIRTSEFRRLNETHRAGNHLTPEDVFLILEING